MLGLTSAGALAQVYQSRDAEGNVVFSDTPTADSKEIDIQNTNTADSVDVPPPTPRDETPPKRAPTEAAPEEGPTYIGGNDNVREDVYSKRRQEELRDRVDGPVAKPEQPVAKPPAAKPRPSPGRR